MDIIKKQTSELIPYARNPRINDAAVDSVAASIKEFGFKVPIIIDAENVIVCGHTRLKAAQKLGLEVVPCVVAADLTPSQIKAYRILDNKLTEKAEWDTELLRLELCELEADGFELEPFDVEFADDLIGETRTADEDDFEPELEKPTNIKRGDLIELGAHRVMCVDSSEAEAGPGELLFTSPPYSDMRSYGGCDLNITTLAAAVFRQPAQFFVVNLGIKRQDSAIVRYWDEWIDAANERGLKLLAWNVWDKGFAGGVSNQNAMFALEHEWLLVFGSAPKPIKRFVEKSENSDKRLQYNKHDSKGRLVRQVRQTDGSMKYSTKGENYESKQLPSIVQCFPEMARNITADHPAVMPVTLPSWFIEAMTEESQAVIDPFLGSGTTLIAADQLDRICYGIEIEPKYCQVIIDRYKAHCEKNDKEFVCKVNGEPYQPPQE